MAVWDAALELGRKSTRHSQALLRALTQPVYDDRRICPLANCDRYIEDGCTAIEHLAQHHGVSKPDEIIDAIKNRHNTLFFSRRRTIISSLLLCLNPYYLYKTYAVIFFIGIYDCIYLSYFLFKPHSRKGVKSIKH